MKSCLICDDHAMIRSAFAGSIRLGWPDTDISEAEDFELGWAAAGKLMPDLILCDLGMPGAAPLEGIEKMLCSSPGSALLVVTAVEDDALLLDLLKLDISGFLPKTASVELFELAVRLVLAGERYIPPRLVSIAAQRAMPGMHIRLTERQIEILRHIGRGQSNKEIARSFNLSPATIKAHVAAITTVLGATNRTEAVALAQAAQLI